MRPLTGVIHILAKERSRDMPRSRNRACLQDGLKLDLNSLMKKGFVRRRYSGVRGIGWTHSYWESLSSALVSADLSDTSSGWLKWEGGLEQFILLATQPRRFGGHQWYFVCPVTRKLASVLWRPPGCNALLQPTSLETTSSLRDPVSGSG